MSIEQKENAMVPPEFYTFLKKAAEILHALGACCLILAWLFRYLHR
jgi:hypothetical protein